jgi:GTP-binding protein
MSEPIVTIVGRPNVGKSTFFNRLVGRRQAIVDDKPGVTRDRNYAVTEWVGQQFLLVDTGGYLPAAKEEIDRAVKEQVEIAIEESDAILFLTDVKTGITDIDLELARLLKNTNKEVLLVVNKVDDIRAESEVGQFYKLGIGEPYPVSAMIGRKTGDLLDVIVAKIAKHPMHEKESDAIKFAVIGKENVGKSSLVNTLLNRERQIVTKIPGTTRDSIDSRFRYQNKEFVIIDTAGLKRRARIKENILFYSNLRTYRSIRRCNVMVYMIDANDGITKQDIQVLTEAAQERKGLICVFNKWDMVEKDHKTMDKLKKYIYDRLGELRYVPLLFTSVLEKKRLYKMLDMISAIFAEREKRIPTSELNDYFQPLLAAKTPPAIQGKEIKINYVAQIKSNPPLFAFYSNHPDLIANNYKRYLENRLRDKFGFKGVPIKLSFRKK